MQPASILITGASSGIGEALALAYARPATHLFLSGRDQARLNAIADSCRAKGARVDSKVIDVADKAAMERWVADAQAKAPLDLVIANAGISTATDSMGESEEKCRAIFAVNLEGVLNTVWPALPGMRARRQGQIAIISSIASFRGLAGAPAYCASKGAVRMWGEGLRDWLRAEGVQVSVVCPGFVTTRMTANNKFPMPWIMDATRAAGIIAKGLAENKGRIAFPFQFRVLTWALAALPDSWAEWLTQRLPRKTA